MPIICFSGFKISVIFFGEREMTSEAESVTAGLGSRRLLSVPEDTALRIPEDEASPVRPVSLVSEVSEVRCHPRLTKAEPVTASRQISLWLLRSSAQESVVTNYTNRKV